MKYFTDRKGMLQLLVANYGNKKPYLNIIPIIKFSYSPIDESQIGNLGSHYWLYGTQAYVEYALQQYFQIEKLLYILII